MSVKLLWHGHSTWELHSGEHRIIIDPFLKDNPAAKATPSEIKVDHVLLTHGHFDHVADAAEIANANQAMLVANYEIATWFESNAGVANTLGMNLGGRATLPFGSVKMTLAHHSSQLPDGSYGGNPGGFVVETSGKKVYFAGDTALFSDLGLLADEQIDIAILPIGDLFTMGPEDSVRAAKLVGAKTVIPTHYGTWPPIEQDTGKWSDAISAAGMTPIVPVVGEAFEI
jgi:L-ascorbate metabolism protein UlaG (beta-lactamase superfamily)